MTPQELERLGAAQLRDLAARHAIADAGTLKRPDLIAALAKVTGISGPGRAPQQQVAPPAGSSSGAQPHQPQSRAPHQADPGLPIPDRYGRDRLVLMVQDPFHVFAYWELSAHALDQARTACGETGTPVLVLITPTGTEQREVDLRGGNYYLSVAPNSTYEAQLALRDSSGRLHPLARSNKVTTPPSSISPRRDEQWMSVDDAFGELLEMAGLPSQGQGSAARLADQQRQQWVWETHDTSSPSMSSHLVGSSGNLSSWHLSSASLVREREAAAQRAGDGQHAGDGQRTTATPGDESSAARNAAPDLNGFPE